MAQWRVEHWTIAGVHTGYRVVRNASRHLEISGSFLGNTYVPGSFAEAKRKADAHAALLNHDQARAA